MINLTFVISSSNKNSIAALCAALDKIDNFENLFNVRFIEQDNIISNPVLKFDDREIICFSFQTPDVFAIQSLVEAIRKENKEVILIAGGAHPSGAYNHTLDMGFDYVFVGEGEEIFIEFLNKYISKKDDHENIKGIAFKKDGKIIFTGKAKMVDINKFLPVSSKFRLFTPIEITRGCPYGCYYCQTTYLFGKVRHRGIPQILNSVKILINHGWDEIRFVSPNILSYGSKDGIKSNLPELEKMLASVKKVRGVRKIYAGNFPSEVRPENLTKEASLILKNYSDNDNIIIGFQSGSDSVLKRMHRQHTVKDALLAVERALDVGFKVNVDFIFGNPRETRKEEEETIRIIEKLSKLSKVRIHGHAFLPLAGTPWQNEKAGRISKKLREFLEYLKKSGKIYGDWKEQEEIGKKINFLKM